MRLQERRAHDRGDGDRGREPGDREDPRPRAHLAARVPVAAGRRSLIPYRYILESHAELPRPAGPGEGRDRRGGRDPRPRASRRSRRSALRRRPRGRRVGRRPHSRRDARLPRPLRVADRAGGARPRPADRRLLRRRLALGVRGEDAPGARLRERRLARRRLHRLEAQRLPDAAAPLARRGEALAVQPPHPHPGGRRRGPAQAARVADPADRRRRPRLARLALSRRGRRRHARHRRRRPGRRVEPPAPDRALDRRRSATGRPTPRRRRSRR